MTTVSKTCVQALLKTYSAKIIHLYRFKFNIKSNQIITKICILFTVQCNSHFHASLQTSVHTNDSSSAENIDQSTHLHRSSLQIYGSKYVISCSHFQQTVDDSIHGSVVKTTRFHPLVPWCQSRCVQYESFGDASRRHCSCAPENSHFTQPSLCNAGLHDVRRPLWQQLIPAKCCKHSCRIGINRRNPPTAHKVG